jgi:hypothetical protein
VGYKQVHIIFRNYSATIIQRKYRKHKATAKAQLLEPVEPTLKEEIKEELAYKDHELNEYVESLEKAKIQLALYRGDIPITDIDAEYIEKIRKEVLSLTEYVNITQTTLEGSTITRKNNGVAERINKKRVFQRRIKAT